MNGSPRNSYVYPFSPARGSLRVVNPPADEDITLSQETIRPYKEASPLPQKGRPCISRSSTIDTMGREHDLEMQRLRDGGLIPLRLGTPPVGRVRDMPPAYPCSAASSQRSGSVMRRAELYVKDNPCLIGIYVAGSMAALITLSLAVSNFTRIGHYLEHSPNSTASAAAAMVTQAASSIVSRPS